MHFTVTWHPSAERELSEIWLNTANRKAITEAVASIDTTLGTIPTESGEDFYGDRLLVADPVSVVYAISEQDRKVIVLQVWCRGE